MTSSVLGAERRLEPGLIEQTLGVPHGTETLPGVLWRPKSGAPAPLVLFGHGFGLDKRHPFPEEQVKALARDRGLVLAGIDAPFHGERRPSDLSAPDDVWSQYSARWQTTRGVAFAEELATTIDAVSSLAFVDGTRVGFWGLSLATQSGLALLSRRPVSAAVLGLFGAGPLVSRFARETSCPVFFVAQRDDEVHPYAAVRQLFEEIGSEEKILRSSPGAHTATPPEVFREAADFLEAHLRATPGSR